MTTLKGPAPDVATELTVSKEGARRFFVGLAWTPRELPKLKIDVAAAPDKKDTTGNIVYFMMKPFDFFRILFLSIIKLFAADMNAQMSRRGQDEEGRDVNASQFDLDLDCYIFGPDLKLKFLVTTENNDNVIDPSRKVYHSGDDQSGMGGGDSEQLFVETKDLPADYAHFFFVVRSDCKYSLDQFKNPTTRLSDSKTEMDVLKTSIAPPAGKPAFNYAFCHVYRDGDVWRFRSLDRYEGDGVEWETYLPALVGKQAA